ncbi:hypothetical protein EN828_31720 [Mesorhizobium sp. M2D.F.Ca.ET.185.01.1.1]|uniref:hypothetical protein n=1 Tax=unclassified Mesorhizobium TaxID=325217 RepID=UPI000FC9E381|nr:MULTISPECIES: hypothetical protein [unclassified Mesorhizobium]TGP52626.1 hypothetical protein EN873_15285 [bacterium M00.F.Ca.ET.230.01.1.1]TGP72886.1 hypothetical protein EN870_31685 [bacterium M00.F.Ca.ET.227.01.1.1]TGP86564.1 hypothetical protein EN864_25110 [bacterium M00.F.Ca.ET.221.01.1.1]TGP87663.1 hypothetical protein EN865_29620 [bacterium M00.F.Ca.ET.222.01.1.1]TGT73149.1 hypothetical protein EN802_14985 [bacterium M00.F.Ca.ET.159.01.1.1]TGT84188.1 hypothetical protein EN800_145
MVDDLSTADGPATDRNIEEARLLLRFFVFGLQAIERAMPQKPLRVLSDIAPGQEKARRNDPAGVTGGILAGYQAASTAFGSTIS